MTREEYRQAYNLIEQEALQKKNALGQQMLNERLYPDGFIVRRKLRPRIETKTDEEIASGPIIGATIAGDDVYYHAYITHPSDYRGPQSTQNYDIPDGKYETFYQSFLLNGTGDDGEIPKQPPPERPICQPYPSDHSPNGPKG